MTVTGCSYIELLQKSNCVFCYLFGSQMRLTHKLVYIVSVVELLFKAEAQCFYIAVTVETCYLFAETALKNSVLKSYHNIVVFLEVFKYILVNSRDIVGIYKSGSGACLFFDKLCRFLTELIEGAKRYHCYP